MVQPPPDPSKKPLAILLWVLIVILVVPCFCFAGCAGLGVLGIATGKKGMDAVEKTQKEAESALRVEKLGATKDGFSRYVTGTVVNDSAKDFGYVQVEINLIDKSGAVVGSTMANMNNLGPHKTWKFKAMVTDEDAVNFQVKNITGF